MRIEIACPASIAAFKLRRRKRSDAMRTLGQRNEQANSRKLGLWATLCGCEWSQPSASRICVPSSKKNRAAWRYGERA